MTERNWLLEAMAASRSRTSWNGWLETAEKPASDHEEQKIERAARVASDIVTANTWMTLNGITVRPQGSYFNNTNVRLEADMDLRVEIPDIRTLFLDGLSAADVGHIKSFSDTGRTFEQVNSQIRAQLETDLVKDFGRGAVDASGQKAIKVHGLDGSRADCDLVPTFTLNAFKKGGYGTYMLEGVAILSRSTNEWTYNFPGHHHSNGIAKRSNTAHRFKRIVRMLKRLNYELTDLHMIQRCIPSFYVECLVYCVEDAFFLVESDDRYDRMIRILTRLSEQLADRSWCHEATEVNEMKYLFRANASWSPEEARAFVESALARLRAQR